MTNLQTSLDNLVASTDTQAAALPADNMQTLGVLHPWSAEAELPSLPGTICVPIKFREVKKNGVAVPGKRPNVYVRRPDFITTDFITEHADLLSSAIRDLLNHEYNEYLDAQHRSKNVTRFFPESCNAANLLSILNERGFGNLTAEDIFRWYASDLMQQLESAIYAAKGIDPTTVSEGVKSKIDAHIAIRGEMFVSIASKLPVKADRDRMVADILATGAEVTPIGERIITMFAAADAEEENSISEFDL